MKTKNLHHSQLQLFRDLRNMASLNRQYSPDEKLARIAARWEARFDKQIQKLTIRIRLSR
jgi:hypothetical protein